MNKFTDRAQRVISLAQEASKHTRSGWVEPAHILLGLLDLGEGTAHKILLRTGVDAKKLRSQAEGSIPAAIVDSFVGEIKFSPHALRVLEHAMYEAQASVEEFVGTEHILIGLLCIEGTAVILRDNGLTASSCRQLIPELTERAPKVLMELSYEVPNIRVKLLATGEVETIGLAPGGSLGSSARFNTVDDFEQYIAVVKNDWLNSKDDKLGTSELRISLLSWIENHALPELKKIKR